MYRILQQYIDSKITDDTVLIFDMDGTLIDTDYANFLSYKHAIENITKSQIDIEYNPDERFNRTLLKKHLPNLTEIEYLKVIESKEDSYKHKLYRTKLNESVSKILFKYYKTNKTILVTNCREQRALTTLKYHNLVDKFDQLFYRQDFICGKRLNKYKNAINQLNISVENVLVFENEKEEIHDAILAGITINNIIYIKL